MGTRTRTLGARTSDSQTDRHREREGEREGGTRCTRVSSSQPSRLCASGKGILAADESPGTLGKRLKNTEELCHLENNEEIRRKYREILVTSDTGACFSGVILHEETLKQSTKGGQSFVECLKD